MRTLRTVLVLLVGLGMAAGCGHDPLGARQSPVQPAAPEVTPSPTPTPPTGGSPTPTPTPSPTPTPGPALTPTPTPSSLTGLWSGTSNDISANNEPGCMVRTDPLVMRISQTGSDLSIELRSANPSLDPLETGGMMIVSGTLNGDQITASGRQDYQLANSKGEMEDHYTLVDLEGTLSGGTITGSYATQSCNKTLSTCYCAKTGSFTVSR